MQQSAPGWKVPPRNFLRMCRRNLRRPKIADSTGAGIDRRRSADVRPGSAASVATQVLAADENNVGLLIPPSVGGRAGQRRLAARPAACR